MLYICLLFVIILIALVIRKSALWGRELRVFGESTKLARYLRGPPYKRVFENSGLCYRTSAYLKVGLKMAVEFRR
jgi:hypothetical protein